MLVASRISIHSEDEETATLTIAGVWMAVSSSKTAAGIKIRSNNFRKRSCCPIAKRYRSGVVLETAIMRLGLSAVAPGDIFEELRFAVQISFCETGERDLVLPQQVF